MKLIDGAAEVLLDADAKAVVGRLVEELTRSRASL